MRHGNSSDCIRFHQISSDFITSHEISSEFHLVRVVVKHPNQI